ncbi:MAG: hypothetical protein JXN65_03490 [Clostridia bacterium]|nr:hypothetical protein [Clostridia bacterium]
MKEFALYKGEDLLGIGTIKELAKKNNVKEATIKFYGTNSYKRRVEKRQRSTNAKALICLDESEAEDE